MKKTRNLNAPRLAKTDKKAKLPKTASKRRKGETGETCSSANCINADGSVVDVPISDDEELCAIILAKRRNLQVATVSIDDLPQDILVRIFEMLNVSTRIRIERVCRRWCQTARHLSWTRTQTITYATLADSTLIDRQDSSFLSLSRSSSPSSLISTTSFSSSTDSGDDTYDFYLDRYRSPAGASRCRPTLSNSSLKHLLERCGRYVSHINLSGYRDTIDYRALTMIARYAPTLESIDLTGIVVTNSSLRSLASSCYRLKSVTLRQCFQDCVVDRGLECLLNSCQNLVKLNLSENERIAGFCLSAMPSSVTELHLSSCCELCDDAIKAVADRCNKLEILNLDSCNDITVDALSYVVDRLSSSLRVLRIGDMYTSWGLDNPPPRIRNLERLHQLTDLSMRENYYIDDSVIAAVARGCRKLETLDISGSNKSLTDDSILALSQFSAETLTHLNLSYMIYLTDAGVRALAKCTNLHMLLMAGCGYVTNSSLTELASRCTKLRIVDLSECVGISGATVKAFYSSAVSSLKRLNCGRGNGGKRGKKALSPVTTPMLQPSVVTLIVRETSVRPGTVQKYKHPLLDVSFQDFRCVFT